MEKTITAILIIVLISLCGCTSKAGSAVVTPGTEETDTLYYPLDSIPSGDAEVHICASEDGKMKFYSWCNADESGQAPACRVLCQYRTSDGGSNVVEVDRVNYVTVVHSLTKDSGYTYYIFPLTESISDSESFSSVVAFTIDCDTLREVSVYDGGDDLDDCGMEIIYNTSEWSFATNGEGWDWLFEYDAKTRMLYVPIVVHDNGDLRFISDRYKVYHFDGEGFADMGEHPHKGLHESLSDYRRLASYFKTENHIVRIDKMHDDSYRYASWKSSSGMSEKPDEIIMGGTYDEKTKVFTFTKDGVEFIVGEVEEAQISEDETAYVKPQSGLTKTR